MDSESFNRILWASRRGMLELDLVLGPFARECYPGLSETEQRQYRQLLECEDQDLFGWFLGKEVPGNPELKAIVEKVLAFSRG